MSYKTWNVGDVLTAAEMNAYVRDQGTILCTSATRPTGTLTEGLHIYETDTKNEYVWDGAAWVLLLAGGAWASYTPTLGGFTASVGLARYAQIARTVHVVVNLTLTSAVSAQMTISLPTAIAAPWDGPYPTLGVAVATDVSPLARVIGAAYYEPTFNKVSMMSSAGLWASAIPHAWASGDQVSLQLTYEAA